MQADGVRILARECGRARARTRKHIRMPLVTWHNRNSENESKCEKGAYEREKIRNGFDRKSNLECECEGMCECDR